MLALSSGSRPLDLDAGIYPDHENVKGINIGVDMSEEPIPTLPVSPIHSGKLSDPDIRQKFFDTLAATGSVTEACKAAGVSRTAVYVLRDKDEVFKGQWDVAAKLGADALEDEAVRRAMEGIDKPIVWQGEIMQDTIVDNATGEVKSVPRTVKEFDNGLLKFLLAANKPDKFKNRTAVEESGPGGGPIQHLNTIRVEFVDAVDPNKKPE